MSHLFKFKQFAIDQDRCAMKIGTDGVLLGAWANIENQPKAILDIGAGTGILSLMLAQRTSAETIEALDIDEDAFEQCVENFEASPWADRLFCYHAGLDEFVTEIEEPYDLIISNPPFYAEDVSSGNSSRDTARQNQALPFDELLDGAAKLLSADGLFATILPYKEEEAFISLGISHGLFPVRKLRVKGNATAAVKRSLLEFSFQQREVLQEVLTIERARHQYTDDYIALTKDFYLNM